jgi:hypothetical protein
VTRSPGWRLGVLGLALCSIAGLVRADEGEVQSIFRYRGRSGRMVYVNGLSRVPERQRGKALPVDLSHVSLNESLSADLQRAVGEQLTDLRAGDYCRTVRGLASRSFWRTAWERQGHLVLLAGLILLFLLFSPYLVRTVGAARWVKLTLVLAPLCLLIGLAGTVAAQTSQSLRALRSRADPCEGGDAGDEVRTPAAGARRIHMLQQLRRQLEAAHELRGVQLERALEGERGP